jgi:hypothetical protein
MSVMCMTIDIDEHKPQCQMNASGRSLKELARSLPLHCLEFTFWNGESLHSMIQGVVHIHKFGNCEYLNHLPLDIFTTSVNLQVKRCDAKPRVKLVEQIKTYFMKETYSSRNTEGSCQGCEFFRCGNVLLANLMDNEELIIHLDLDCYKVAMYGTHSFQLASQTRSSRFSHISMWRSYRRSSL